MRTLALIPLLGTAVAVAAPVPKDGVDRFPEPHSAARRFLEALKNDDPAAAQKCWATVPGVTADIVRLHVARMVAIRRTTRAAVARFGEKGEAALGPFPTADLSDAAIDRTLKAIAAAEASTMSGGNRAAISLPPTPAGKAWAYPMAADSVTIWFVKRGADWKLSGERFSDIPDVLQHYRDLQDGKTPVPAMSHWQLRDEATVLNDLADRLDNGEYRTAADLAAALGAKLDAVRLYHETANFTPH